ncbi:MAG TPA: LysE family transporter [Steroidobacteraceae bacterium]|jgi:threonine/homoserine/homoserine lactone efflux protein
MSKELLLKSLVLGLSIAAPVGPIGILCIRRSLVEGRIAGLICGLGAASADALYGAVGAFALNGISAWLVRGRLWMTLAGSGFLLYLGVRIFRAPPPETTARATGSATGAYVSTFVLTLANPLTILSFAAAFAGMGAGAVGYGGVVTMLVGVFVGSAIWWLMLTTVAGTARGRLSPPFFVAINRVSGALLMGFGLYTLTRLFI